MVGAFAFSSSYHMTLGGQKYVEELWRQFFSDPSQWVDHRLEKVNPRYPDFKQPKTGVALWINAKSCPSWVRAELAILKPGCAQSSPLSWNAALRRYVKSGQELQALESFREMQAAGVNPDSYTFVMVINACASIGALEEGRSVHAHVIQSCEEVDVRVASSLVSMYAKCRSMNDAWRVFNDMVTHDVVSWTALIMGHVKCGQGKRALELFRLMQADGVQPDGVTFVMVLNACAGSAALEEGRCVHSQAVESGWGTDVQVANALVDMYAKCGSIEDARTVFNEMPTRDVVSWTAMLGGYVKCEQAQAALDLYHKMEAEDVTPTTITFLTIINACASLVALEEGRHVHAQIVDSNCQSDLRVANALVDMYAKCGSIDDAQRVFNAMCSRNVVSWTAMLVGYVKSEQGLKALELYRQMQEEGVKPDTVTFVMAINACASLSALEQGRRIHSQIIQSHCESYLSVGNSLIDMYVKCGSIEDAERVFNKMTTRDVVSWTSLLVGYVRFEQGRKGLELYRQMEKEDLKLNTVAYAAVCHACASMASLREAKNVHAKVIENGFESDVFVGNSLVDMYAKCGSLEDAQRVFKGMPMRNTVSWNTMLGALALYGHGKEALQLFEEMSHAGVELNFITFVSLLSACSHAGLVDEGLQYFQSMSSVYGISPRADHYVCVVDLLGRAGRLNEAEKIIKGMSSSDSDHIAVAWRTMLSASRNHNNVEFGEHAIKHLLEMDPCSSSLKTEA